jgi:hypothetical protein
MFLLGVLLIVVGVLAILAALFSSSGTASLLGADLSAKTIFLLGVAAGAAILWGFTITKFGARRTIRQRRETRRLQNLSAKMERAEARKNEDDDGSGSA